MPHLSRCGTELCAGGPPVPGQHVAVLTPGWAGLRDGWDRVREPVPAVEAAASSLFSELSGLSQRPVRPVPASAAARDRWARFADLGQPGRESVDVDVLAHAGAITDWCWTPIPAMPFSFPCRCRVASTEW